MTPRTRILLVVAAVAVLVIAFVVASGSGDGNSTTSTPAAQTTPAATAPAETNAAQTTPPETTPAPAAPPVPVVTVVDGQPKRGVQRLEFSKGDTIRFKVESDVADEIHVHGYDIAKDVPAGGSVTFSFPGKIDGRFEVELEHRGVQIAELEVTP